MKIITPIIALILICQLVLMHTVGCNAPSSAVPPAMEPYFTSKISESSKGISLEIRYDGFHRRPNSRGGFIVLDNEVDLENYESDLLLVLEKVREVRQKLNYAQSRALKIDAATVPTDAASTP